MPSTFRKKTTDAVSDEMSPREAAQLLKVRLDGLYTLIWSGKLPATKLDGRWRVSRAEVEKRLCARRKPS